MTKRKFKFCIIAGVLTIASAYPISYWVIRQEWAWNSLPPDIQSWVGTRSGRSTEPVAYETVYKPLISTERWVEENQLRKEVSGTWEGEYRRRLIEVWVTEVDFKRCLFDVYENGELLASLEFEASYKHLRDEHVAKYPMKTFEEYQDREGNSLTVSWGDEPKARLVFKRGMRSDASRDGWARDSNYVYITGVALTRQVPNKTQHHKSDRAGG